MREGVKEEIVIRATRSSGPGGQNVNKVSTKVVLEWEIDISTAYSPSEKDRIKQSADAQGYLTKSGKVIITDQTSRSQFENKKNALLRLASLIRKALAPVKKRFTTKIPKGSKEKRIGEKKRRGERLKGRRRLLDE